MHEVPPGFYRDAIPVRWVPAGFPNAIGVYVSANHSPDVMRVYKASPGAHGIVDVYRLPTISPRASSRPLRDR